MDKAVRLCFVAGFSRDVSLLIKAVLRALETKQKGSYAEILLWKLSFIPCILIERGISSLHVIGLPRYLRSKSEFFFRKRLFICKTMKIKRSPQISPYRYYFNPVFISVIAIKSTMACPFLSSVVFCLHVLYKLTLHLF